MLIYIVASGLALLVLLGWFFRLERTGEQHTIFVVLVSVLLVDALIAGRSAAVPVGLLRPRFLGQDFRLPDLVIVAALLAYGLSGVRRRFGRLGLWWFAALLVYATGMGVGLLSGLPVGQVLFQGKFVLYGVGGIIVASGADIRRTYDSIGPLARVLAVFVPIAFVVRTSGMDFSLTTPVQRLNGLGQLSNDTVTMLVLIGAVALLAEAVRPHRRLSVVVAGFVLLLAPLTSKQRASYLALAIVAIVFVVLVLGSTWRRRSRVTVLEMALAAAALLGVVAVGVLITESPGVITVVTDTFSGEGQAQSAQARVSIASEAIAMIREHPVIGWGVGVRVDAESPGANDRIAAAAHNLVLDMWLRVGAIGLGFFLAAIGVIVAAGVRVWRHATSDGTAAIAMGAVIVVLGVLGKALVEPALDKYRLALALSLAVGLIVAAVRTAHLDDEVVDPIRSRAALR